MRPGFDSQQSDCALQVSLHYAIALLHLYAYVAGGKMIQLGIEAQKVVSRFLKKFIIGVSNGSSNVFERYKQLGRSGEVTRAEFLIRAGGGIDVYISASYNAFDEPKIWFDYHVIVLLNDSILLERCFYPPGNWNELLSLDYRMFGFTDVDSLVAALFVECLNRRKNGVLVPMTDKLSYDFDKRLLKAQEKEYESFVAKLAPLVSGLTFNSEVHH